jgi:hypothetical protein
MQLVKNVIQTYGEVEHSDVRVVTKFALFPTEVNGKIIWLKHYQELWEYIIAERNLFYGKEYMGLLYGGEWELLDVKIL